MMNQVFFAAFADELTKLAGPPPQSALAKHGPHILSAIGGAGLLLGAQRLVKDVQMAEQQRKMMREQQRLQQQGGM